MVSSFTIELLVKPHAKKSLISWDNDLKKYVVYVKNPPIKGKANKEIISLLKKYFKTKTVILKQGFTSSTKVFEIIDPKENIQSIK